MKRSTSKRDLNQVVKVKLPKDYPWQVLGKLVEDLRDFLDPDSLKLVRSIVRNRDVEQYFLLSEEWGPQSITLVGYTASELFARYQISALLKKFQFTGDREKRRSAALKKFKEAELACKFFNDNSKKLAFLDDDTELACYTYAREFLQKVLGSELPESEELTLWSRHGPGSNLDTSHRQVSLYDKYKNWPYSCTKGSLDLARSAIQNDERWLGALEDDYRVKNNLPKHVILDQDVFWANVLKIVPGNRITFVPKNAKTERSIAIEPCMNLYLQLGVDGYIRRRLKRWGIDLDSQKRNQVYAMLGSGHFHNPFVTLDLAAASDSISLELCRLLLPPQWYRYLIKLRSPVGVLDDELVIYEKISSMGNGYTFALESAIFAAICYAVEKHLHGSCQFGSFAVFGDDLIVKTSSSSLVIRMLNLFGFNLNHEKSFIHGHFRESCGADWYNGISVRPVFLTSQPTTAMELWCDINRIRRILSLRIWHGEFETPQFMQKWIPDGVKHHVGPYSDESFDSYLHVPEPVSRYRNGWWKFLHIVVTTKRRKGEDFLFRKLMHSLRAEPAHSWARTETGSRFIITDLRSVIVSQAYSPASYWQEMYTEPFS
jgi:hypothetical protein